MEPLAQPRAHTVTVKNAHVVVREWGERGGRPLLYWHALNPFCALELVEVGPLWAAAGFHVLAPAAPGCGESPRLGDNAYRPVQLADLAIGLADVLELERFDFVGASWGAAIGLRVAGRAPERLRSLVLLDGGYAEVAEDETFAGKSLGEIKEMFVAQQSQFAFTDRAAFLDAMRGRYRRWSAGLEARLLTGLRDENGTLFLASDPEAAAAAMFGIKEEPSADLLPAVTAANMPVLLLMSEDAAGDPKTASDLARFRSLLPRAAVEPIADAGHDLLADAPETTSARVVDWLAGT